MKKVLFTATVTGHITAFHVPYLKYFKDKGFTVDVLSCGEREIPYCDTHYNVSLNRNPLKKENRSAYNQIKKIISENRYDIIHCHTPIAAFLTRLAARKARKTGTRVIYTAHGFHFFKGAPLLNWLLYFPAEWLCSFFTDDLITINREDFAFAKKHLHAGATHYTHGIGADIEKIKGITVDRDKKRAELGIPKSCTAVLSVGELNENKNHETVLRAIASLKRDDIVYVICGNGGKKNFLQALAKELEMEDRLILAGFRSDVTEIYKCCDIFAFPSKREGLPVSVIEAMASGLPCIVSDIRGNNDLVKENENGFLYTPLNISDFADGINSLAKNEDLRNSLAEYGKAFVMPFALDKVKSEMAKIYNA